MNSSIQDAFNLAWKLALATKNLSSSNLLSTYETERLPVIAGVLGKTTELLNRTVAAKVGDSNRVMQRGQDFFQLDVGYPDSPIVFDELSKAEENDKDKVGGEKKLRAGERAPNSPGIVPLTSGLKPGTCELFDIFGPTKHTVLLFPSPHNLRHDVIPYIEAFHQYPRGTARVIVIIPNGFTTWSTEAWGVDTEVVQDRDEYCRSNYPTRCGAKAVVVRPDGCIGAVLKSVEGVIKYRELIFSNSVQL